MTPDDILYAIVTAFVGWELYARFVARNGSAHTLSNRIKTLQKRCRWFRYLSWLVVLVGLPAHLVFHLI